MAPLQSSKMGPESRCNNGMIKSSSPVQLSIILGPKPQESIWSPSGIDLFVNLVIESPEGRKSEDLVSTHSRSEARPSEDPDDQLQESDAITLSIWKSTLPSEDGRNEIQHVSEEINGECRNRIEEQDIIERRAGPSRGSNSGRVHSAAYQPDFEIVSSAIILARGFRNSSPRLREQLEGNLQEADNVIREYFQSNLQEYELETQTGNGTLNLFSRELGDSGKEISPNQYKYDYSEDLDCVNRCKENDENCLPGFASSELHPEFTEREYDWNEGYFSDRSGEITRLDLEPCSQNRSWSPGVDDYSWPSVNDRLTLPTIVEPSEAIRAITNQDNDVSMATNNLYNRNCHEVDNNVDRSPNPSPFPFPHIESFNETEISAAWQLLEMSNICFGFGNRNNDDRQAALQELDVNNIAVPTTSAIPSQPCSGRMITRIDEKSMPIVPLAPDVSKKMKETWWRRSDDTSPPLVDWHHDPLTLRMRRIKPNKAPELCVLNSMAVEI